jgi:hypothetical protein
LYFDSNTIRNTIRSAIINRIHTVLSCSYVVYVILEQHGMTFKMEYVTRGQYSDYTKPYRKYDNPAENTIMVVFPG